MDLFAIFRRRPTYNADHLPPVQQGPAPGGKHWAEKQLLAAPGRYYGDGGTIHGTTWLDIEMDDAGKVIAVWFRCQMLPFKVFNRADPALEGRERDLSPCQLTGVEVRDIARGDQS